MILFVKDKNSLERIRNKKERYEMKDEKIIKRMPTKFELEQMARERKTEDRNLILVSCMVIVLCAATLLLIG